MRIWKIRREGSMPTQFYGETYDKLFFYGRYRHGRLTVVVSTVSEELAIVEGSQVLAIDDGTGDGVMEIDEFVRRCREARVFVKMPDEQAVM